MGPVHACSCVINIVQFTRDIPKFISHWGSVHTVPCTVHEVLNFTLYVLFFTLAWSQRFFFNSSSQTKLSREAALYSVAATASLLNLVSEEERKTWDEGICFSGIRVDPTTCSLLLSVPVHRTQAKPALWSSGNFVTLPRINLARFSVVCHERKSHFFDC